MRWLEGSRTAFCSIKRNANRTLTISMYGLSKYSCLLINTCTYVAPNLNLWIKKKITIFENT